MIRKIRLLAVLSAAFFLTGSGFAQSEGTLPAADSKALYSELETLAKAKDYEKMQSYMQEISSEKSLNAEDALLVELVRRGIDAEGDVSRLKDFPESSLPADKRNEVYFKAARLVMHARDYACAEYLGRTQVKAVPVYTVELIDQSPIGVYGWYNSDLVKDDSKREDRFENYNEEGAALLYLDVNADRSGMDVTKKAEKCQASFFVSADANGISMYVENKDPNVKDAVAGLKSAGGLEMYLQPGFGNVYYQWI